MSTTAHDECEYEYLTANTREQWNKIVNAIFFGDCEIKRTLAKYDNRGIVSFSVCWDPADRVEAGREYRHKKPKPKNVKKLVNRTQEDFWPLIGRYWARDKDGRRYIMACDHWNNAADSQANWQIAPLGSEEWQPMQKEIEVDE